MASSYGYESGKLVWQEESSILRCLPCCFLLAFMRSLLPFLAETGKRLWEESLEAGGLPSRLRALLRCWYILTHIE
jgi:hypothetical protein